MNTTPPSETASLMKSHASWSGLSASSADASTAWCSKVSEPPLSASDEPAPSVDTTAVTPCSSSAPSRLAPMRVPETADTQSPSPTWAIALEQSKLLDDLLDDAPSVVASSSPTLGGRRPPDAAAAPDAPEPPEALSEDVSPACRGALPPPPPPEAALLTLPSATSALASEGAADEASSASAGGAQRAKCPMSGLFAFLNLRGHTPSCKAV
mmetsp:Transcript_4515/g.18395  ORF Transcript_4515/g.18395 Transcript_4515/m.18395 type:complete len:211 (+) Transcript_4515:1127-1759(+)